MSSSSSQDLGSILTQSSSEILSESGQPIQYSNPFLDNISLFRQSSLDIGLIDFFFNKGANPQYVDLDVVGSSSSSSSGGFLLLIALDIGEDDYGDPYKLPEGLEFYFYDEKVDGSVSGGVFSAQKIPDRNEVLVHFSSLTEPSGVEFSFQLNIEHPDFSAVGSVFVFRERRFYTHSASTGPRRKNETGRFPASYISSLHSWIVSFWEAYDLNDFSLVPVLVHPPGNEDSEFDPFQHARWKVMSELGLFESLAVVVGEPEVNGGTGPAGKKPRFGNFLGVSSAVYDCIISGGLYKSYDTKETLEDYVAGKGTRDPKSFDCRAFSLAAAMFLEKQLSTVCKANVKLLTVGGPAVDNYHALCIVELNGCANSSGGTIPDCTDDCCSGSFIYEPQSGQKYSSVDSYCKQNPKLCEQKDKWETRELEDGGDWDSDWENYPAEMDRIKNVICGCLGGNFRDGTSEAILKQKCQGGSFKNWFKQNFAYEAGKSSSPIADIPQILSCKKVSCEKGREGGPTGPLCTQSPDPGTVGTTPYICETECMEKWDCTGDPLFLCNSVYSLKGTQGEYDEESKCLNECSGDKVCVNQWIIKYDCATKQWERLMGGGSFRKCLDRERFPTSEDWSTGDKCNYRYFQLAGGSCESYEDCSACMYNDSSCMPADVLNKLAEFPSPPPSDCCGSWCEIDPNTFDPVGNCVDGTLEDWTFADRAKRAASYKQGVPCYPGDCSQKPRSFFIDNEHWRFAGSKLGEIRETS